MNILGLLKSPMVLMMVFSGGMMFLVPKLVVSQFSATELESGLGADVRVCAGQRGYRSGDGQRGGGDEEEDAGDAEHGFHGVVRAPLASLSASVLMYVASISNMLAGGSEADPAPALSGASVNLTPSKAGGGQGNGAKRRKGR
jgi:hypothetical protein